MKTLQCHSRGDKRFSALFAVVEFNGKQATIEQHYQLCKRFEGKPVPKQISDSKGKTPSHIVVARKRLPASAINGFYTYLWLKYFQAHPDLLAYARTFDEFHDMFGGKSVNRQDHTVRACAKQGLKAVLASPSVQHFISAFRGK
jgi:hypothetical protein